MRCARELTIGLLMLFTGAASAQQPVAVDVINASRATRCAEEDNVYVKLRSPLVRTFRVEASHPPYLKSLAADTVAPDFKSCDMSRDPAHRFAPREVLLHDDGAWTLRGFTYPQFWRPNQVPVRVGERTEKGLHLLQLWTRGRARDEEVLVLYPADGYWRARPLAPEKLGWDVNPKLPTAYGSSFLIGPIEEKVRPFADIKIVTFDPGAGMFWLTFANGMRAVVRVGTLTDERITLDVAMDSIDRAPFAALRSMYVADDNADVTRIALIAPDGGRSETGMMKFTQGRAAAEVWTGRPAPSRHNTSAPDVTFKAFRGFKSEGL